MRHFRCVGKHADAHVYADEWNSSGTERSRAVRIQQTSGLSLPAEAREVPLLSERGRDRSQRRALWSPICFPSLR